MSTQPGLLTPDPTPIPPLEAARRKLAAAEAALAEAEQTCDEQGSEHTAELRAARRTADLAKAEVARWEAAAMVRREP